MIRILSEIGKEGAITPPATWPPRRSPASGARGPARNRYRVQEADPALVPPGETRIVPPRVPEGDGQAGPHHFGIDPVGSVLTETRAGGRGILRSAIIRSAFSGVG